MRTPTVQVRMGEARPRVRLRDFVEAMRAGDAPLDAYVFHDIS